MHSPHLEERTVTSLTALALDVAQHLNAEPGKAVVVCEHPNVAASHTSKQWQQQIRAVQREYASTLDTQKHEELAQKIVRMRSRLFSAASKPELIETTKVDVLFCTVEALLRYAPACHSMYITHPIDHKALHLITAWMQPEDVIICYSIVPQAKRRAERRSTDYYKVKYEIG